MRVSGVEQFVCAVLMRHLWHGASQWGAREVTKIWTRLAQKISQFSFTLAKIFFQVTKDLDLRRKFLNVLWIGKNIALAGKVTKILAHKIPQCPLDSMVFLSACSEVPI